MNVLGYQFEVTGEYDSEHGICMLRSLLTVKVMFWWDYYILPFITVKQLIKFIFRIKTGLVGVECRDNNIVPVVICPYCKRKQAVKYELQKCLNCGKKFFIF